MKEGTGSERNNEKINRSRLQTTPKKKRLFQEIKGISLTQNKQERNQTTTRHTASDRENKHTNKQINEKEHKKSFGIYTSKGSTSKTYLHNRKYSEKI